MGLRPNVAIAQGDFYPNGITPVVLNPDVQATVRPGGTFFRKSAGFEGIRPGKNRFQSAYHGLGINFTPMRFAEDVGEYDSLPLVVDEETSARHADIAELPGSGRLDDEGKLTADGTNGGVKIGTSHRAAPTGGKELHAGNRTPIDMGDRSPSRPLSRAWAREVVTDPVRTFNSEYAEDPVKAVVIAGAIVGAIYYVTREFERSYRSRSARGGVAVIGAAPAAAVATSGEAVKDATEVANQAATAAGGAAQAAASAAGDAAEAAGKAAESVTDAVADAVTEND